MTLNICTFIALFTIVETIKEKQNQQPGGRIERWVCFSRSVFYSKPMMLNFIKVRRIRREVQNFCTNTFSKFTDFGDLWKLALSKITVCSDCNIGTKNCSNQPLKTSVSQYPSKVIGAKIFPLLKAAIMLSFLT